MSSLPTLAANLPAPRRCQAFETCKGANCSHKPNLGFAKPVLAGQSEEIPGNLNHNFKMLELLGKYGSCDMYAVAEGLRIEDVSGLNLTVSPGHAFGEHLIELAEAQTNTLWDNAVNLIYLNNGGVVEAAQLGEAQPEDSVYLMAVRMENGQMAEYSFEGVFQLRAGNVFRRVADEDMPGDSPECEPSWFYTITKSGIWLWDGEKYWKTAS